MTNISSLPGSTSKLFQSLLRAVFLIVATVGGFFIFAASAAFALFVIIGLIVLGFIVFGILWLRAKILGKPLSSFQITRHPMGKMWTSETFSSNNSRSGKNPTANENRSNGDTSSSRNDGPVLDAHQTPDGWSVDSD